MNKTEKREVRYNLTIILICGIGLGLFVGILFSISININDKTEIVCHDMSEFNETLNLIQKNCGSTQITQKYNDDNWFIFQANVCDGKKCESKYIPINECVLEQENEK